MSANLPTRRWARLAALATSGAVLLSGCSFSIYDLPLPGGADVGDDPYRVTVEFRDVLDLVPQSTVKVDDITVGRVEEVTLDGYHADVTLLLDRSVELPSNAEAEIRQTSLLGEKFVSLKPPASDPSSELLDEGDVIELDRTGRNVEVEEVLGALSLVLNGGGIAQLKTITNELNKALEGREASVKSVLRQMRLMMTQFDNSKEDIVATIDRVNSLAISVNRRTDDIELALDELPAAIESIDRQRDDLVKMLKALSELSGVATRVIQASKQGTIDSLNALAPTLTELAKSGDDFANSLQIVLTFPFIDGVVGTNPAQARDLHMGDYTNLSIVLELDLRNGIPAIGNPEGGEGTPEIPLPNLPLPNVPLPTVGVPDVGGGGGGGGNDDGDGGLLGGLGLGRAAVGADAATGSSDVPAGEAAQVDTDLAAMLVWGAMPR
jgi:phospholipid/cholesterol/gamma-HCH transport system substrate-binding protein